MEDSKNININKNLEDSRMKLDDLGKQILGYGDFVEELISPNTTPVNLDNFTINRIKSLQNNIFDVKGNVKGTKYNIGDYAYSLISNNQFDHGDITNMLGGRASLNAEMNYILNEMPELQSALDMLADDVVYPNVSSESGIKIEFIGVDKDNDSERYDSLIKYFKPLDNPLHTLANRKVYNYDIESDIKEIVTRFGIYGHMIVATIPYRKIAQDLLFDKSEEDIHKFGVESKAEAMDILNKTYKKQFKPYSESLNIDGLSNIVDKNINNSLRNIVSNVPYSESDISYVMHLLDNDELYSDELGGSKLVGNVKGNILSLLTPISEDNLNTLEMMNLNKLKEKNNKKFNIDKLKGCTTDILDPSKTIPIYIKDELLGVYVVEDEVIGQGFTLNLNNSMSNLINASTLKDDNSNQTLSTEYSNKIRDILFNDIKNILADGLNKNFLKNNPNLIEDIEFILKSNKNWSQPRVRFIPSEFLTIHKIGQGALGTPLLLKARRYAHMYITLLKSDMLAKVFFEKPKYKIRVPFNGDQSNLARIMQSVDGFRGAIPNMSSMGLPDVLNISSASYHTIVMPTTPEGGDMYEIDQLPAIEGRDNSDLLRQLRNQATLTIGYPADLFDPTQQVDFAKKIANLDMRVLVRIFSIQKSLSLSLSDFCTKRLRYLIDNEDIQVKVTFEVPSELTENISADTIQRKNTLSDVMFTFVDQDPRIPDEHRNQVKQYINKKLLEGVIDMSLIDEAIEKVTTYQEGTRQVEIGG